MQQFGFVESAYALLLLLSEEIVVAYSAMTNAHSLYFQFLSQSWSVEDAFDAEDFGTFSDVGSSLSLEPVYRLDHEEVGEYVLPEIFRDGSQLVEVFIHVGMHRGSLCPDFTFYYMELIVFYEGNIYFIVSVDRSFSVNLYGLCDEL